MTEIRDKNIHFVGIKGAGVSALAAILMSRGARVCGSDVAEHFFTDAILSSGRIRREMFSVEHITKDPIDCVIYSTAWKDSEEVILAVKRGLPVLSYPEALAELIAKGFSIAVAGSHGKTTTTGLLAHILKQGGHDISAVIGSMVTQYETNAFTGTSDIIVFEADEYEDKLALYEPRAALITNIDYDHPDFFHDAGQYDSVFRIFAEKILNAGGTVVACGDDEGVRRTVRRDILLYGSMKEYPYAVRDISLSEGRTYYTLYKNASEVGRFSLLLPGVHNVVNACGAIALADTLGFVAADNAAILAQEFRGTSRRFEYKGQYHGVSVYDDFAHHPTEISTTLSTARALFPNKRIWCVFGAHTFTRTEMFFGAFAKSFTAVDHVLVLNIYGSAREARGTVTARDLALAILHESGNAEYVGTHENALAEIFAHIDEIDILITMGAGDGYQIGEMLLSHK